MLYGHPIAYESRKLNDTERRYTVQEKEMTAIVHCLRTWSQTLFVGVTIRGQDGESGDELLPDPSSSQAKTGTMASKTNFLRLIDMVL